MDSLGYICCQFHVNRSCLLHFGQVQKLRKESLFPTKSLGISMEMENPVLTECNLSINVCASFTLFPRITPHKDWQNQQFSALVIKFSNVLEYLAYNFTDEGFCPSET